MSLRLYRPGPDGLEPTPVEVRTWRSRLRSRRWNPAALDNPEFAPTSQRLAVIFWLALTLRHLRDHPRRLRRRSLAPARLTSAISDGWRS